MSLKISHANSETTPTADQLSLRGFDPIKDKGIQVTHKQTLDKVGDAKFSVDDDTLVIGGKPVSTGTDDYSDALKLNVEFRKNPYETHLRSDIGMFGKVGRALSVAELRTLENDDRFCRNSEYVTLDTATGKRMKLSDILSKDEIDEVEAELKKACAERSDGGATIDFGGMREQAMDSFGVRPNPKTGKPELRVFVDSPNGRGDSVSVTVELTDAQIMRLNATPAKPALASKARQDNDGVLYATVNGVEYKLTEKNEWLGKLGMPAVPDPIILAGGRMVAYFLAGEENLRMANVFDLKTGKDVPIWSTTGEDVVFCKPVATPTGPVVMIESSGGGDHKHMVQIIDPLNGSVAYSMLNAEVTKSGGKPVISNGKISITRFDDNGKKIETVAFDVFKSHERTRAKVMELPTEVTLGKYSSFSLTRDGDNGITLGFQNQASGEAFEPKVESIAVYDKRTGRIVSRNEYPLLTKRDGAHGSWGYDVSSANMWNFPADCVVVANVRAGGKTFVLRSK